MAALIVRTLFNKNTNERKIFVFDEVEECWYLSNGSDKFLRKATDDEHKQLKGIPALAVRRKVSAALREKENDVGEKEFNENMGYSRANKLRSVKLLDLIGRRLKNPDETFTSAVKGSISDKFKAKMVGIKEKFDPLNIARNIAGDFGAGIVGRLTNASEERMDYFIKGDTLSYKKNKKKKDPLYSKVNDKENKPVVKNDALGDVVGKLYNLIKNYHEEDIKRLELDKDFKEEQDANRERWNNELISALTGKQIGSTSTAKPIEKPKENSIFEKFKEVETVLDVLKDAKWLLSALASPAALVAALGIGSLVAAEFLKGKLEKSTEEKAGEAGGEKAQAAMKEIHENRRRDPEETNLTDESQEYVQQQIKREQTVSKEIKKKQDLIGTFLLDKGYDRYRKTYMGGLFNGGYTFQDKKGMEPPPELLKQADEYAERKMKQVPAPVTTKGAAKPVEPPKKAPTGTMTSTTPILSAMAVPIEPEPNPLGQRVQAAINTNNEMNMAPPENKSIIIDKSKTINAGGGQSSGAISLDSASVRSDESTYLKTQKQSLRPV
jgi:hypothetical protein